jgi:hypothetical protein
MSERVYSYTWDGTSLTNPQLLVDLPAGPRTKYNKYEEKWLMIHHHGSPISNYIPPNVLI